MYFRDLSTRIVFICDYQDIENDMYDYINKL